MKGTMFNLLEEFVIGGWGEDAYERVLARCPHAGAVAYVGPGTYDDELFLQIVGAVCAELGVEVSAGVRAYGRFAMPRLAARFPLFTAGHVHPRTFLASIDDVIHVEVKKVMDAAEPPRILATTAPDGGMILRYASRRRLCDAMAGLIDGTGDFFGVPITHHEVRCARDGAPACEFHLTFEGG